MPQAVEAYVRGENFTEIDRIKQSVRLSRYMKMILEK